MLALTLIAAACGGGAGPDAAADAPTAETDGGSPDELALFDAPDEAPTAAEATPLADPLRLGVVGGPVFDPMDVTVLEPERIAVLDLVYDGLTEPEGETWSPALAATVDVSDDGLTWRFVLDGTAVFSNGQPITAADAEFSIRRVVEANNGVAPLRFGPLLSIEAVDVETLEITLSEPYATLPLLLASPRFGIVPDVDPDGTVASGPFVVSGSDAETTRLEVVAGWTNEAQRNEPAAIELVALDERPTVLGDLDVVLLDASEGDPAVVTTVESNVEVHLALNTGRFELRGEAVRREIVAAVDGDALASEVFGGAAVAAPPFGPVDDAEPLEPWPLPGPLHFDYVASSQAEDALAAAVVAQLIAAGIDAEARPHGLDEFVALVAAGDHELFRSGWVGMVPNVDSRLAPFQSSDADNTTALADAEFDAAFAVARSSGLASDFDVAGGVLADAAVVKPLVRLVRSYAVSERMDGLVIRSDGSLDLSSIDPG